MKYKHANRKRSRKTVHAQTNPMKFSTAKNTPLFFRKTHTTENPINMFSWIFFEKKSLLFFISFIFCVCEKKNRGRKVKKAKILCIFQHKH